MARRTQAIEERKVGNIRITIVGGLVLVVAFASSVVASASASELEQIPSAGGFTVMSGASTFETIGGTKLTCSADKGSGELTGIKTDESKVTFEKCKSSGISCSNVEMSIKGELVWLNEPAGLVGEKLELAKPAKVTCFIISLEVTGATLCPVEPVNEAIKEVKIVCKQSKGKQEYTEFENEKGERFKATTITGSEESGLEDTETLVLEKEHEIRTNGPKVKVEPKILAFKELKVGEEKELPLAYTNEGKGRWEPAFIFKKVEGEVGAWGVKLGAIPCDKVVAEGKTCEEIVTFAPKAEKAGKLKAKLTTIPGSEVVVVEGAGR